MRESVPLSSSEPSATGASSQVPCCLTSPQLTCFRSLSRPPLPPSTRSPPPLSFVLPPFFACSRLPRPATTLRAYRPLPPLASMVSFRHWLGSDRSRGMETRSGREVDLEPVEPVTRGCMVALSRRRLGRAQGLARVYWQAYGQERAIRALCAPRRARRACLSNSPAVETRPPTRITTKTLRHPLARIRADRVSSAYSPSLSTFSTRRRSRLPRPTSSRGLCSALPFPRS